MKKIIFAIAICFAFTSCVGGGSKTALLAEDATKSVAATTKYKIESLLGQADSLVGKEVVVLGTVTHTCKHSGRRCFIIGDDQKTTMRIEAKGDIGGFNRELIGSQLAITGILRENRLSGEYLDAWQEKVNEKMGKEDGSVESCHAETNNINAMREWMKANNKEYYSLLYMDGTSFEVVE